MTRKKRLCKAGKRRTPKPTMSGRDIQRVQIEAAAIASVTALQDFQSDEVLSGEKLETAARFVLTLRAPVLPKYDLTTLAAVFVPSFCTVYQARISGYLADLAAYTHDMLTFGNLNPRDLIRWYIQMHGPQSDVG